MIRNDNHKPVEISRLLSTVFKEKKWRSRLELHSVFQFWDKAVGKEIAANARPSLIRGTTLWVKVKDSIWMQHLHLQKILLLEKINRELDNEKLSDIHFQLDSSLAAPPEPESTEAKPPLLDKKQEQEFDKLISSFEDENLKASLKNLWVKMKTKGQ
jgi:predicted nucleic acid-binding Zn ribbon protein